jgi:hypothetical protein
MYCFRVLSPRGLPLCGECDACMNGLCGTLIFNRRARQDEI